LIAVVALLLGAEFGRASGIEVTIINFVSALLAGNIAGYRREVYNRRNFWMKHQLDPEFSKVSDPRKAFYDLIVPPTESYASLNDIRHSESTQVTSFCQEPIRYIKRNFLLLHDSVKVEHDFNQFIAKQSLGQTRLTLYVMAISIIVGLIFEGLNRSLLLIDLAIRGLFVPAILISMSLMRAFVRDRHPKTTQNMGIIAVLSIIVLYFGIVAAKSFSDGSGWSTDDNIAIRIAQIAMISHQSFGLRLHKYLALALIYLCLSIPMQVIFKMRNNSYIIGCNGAFIATCFFAHYYERLLFVYFTLSKALNYKKDKMRSLPREAAKTAEI
jgi:hypothetical protein